MIGAKVFSAGLPMPLMECMCKDVATSVSAAGTTQGTATELTTADNEITTAAAGSGVILAVKVYPPSGFKINALSSDAPMLLAVNTGCLFKCVSSTRVFGVLSA